VLACGCRYSKGAFWFGYEWREVWRRFKRCSKQCKAPGMLKDEI